MKINGDLTKPVLLDAGSIEWVPSPAAGVDRRMLYREGTEVARATSIVRYAVGSAFPPHVHSGGEEIMVLSGTFQDEYGDYPAGSYFRNPPGTSHSPAAAEGCEIFVRLWQFRQGDTAHIIRRPGEGDPLPPRDGVDLARLLFDDRAERVVIESWAANATVTVINTRGLEFLILSGSLAVDGQTLPALGWGRLPAGQDFTATAGAEGVKVWIKDAPLQHPDVLTMPV